MFVLFGLYLTKIQLLTLTCAVLAALFFVVSVFISPRYRFFFISAAFLAATVPVLFLPVSGAGEKINLTLNAFSKYNLKHTLENAMLLFPTAFFAVIGGVNAAISTAVCIVYSLFCETVQLALPGRVFDVNDIVANAAGVLAACLTATAIIIIAKGNGYEIQNTRNVFVINRIRSNGRQIA